MSEIKIDSHDDPTQPVDLKSNAPANPTRRKLTNAGLGVSAIFTLASRPVLAAQCVTASAAASGNLSQHGTAAPCVGRKPDYWKQAIHAKEWILPYSQGKCSGSGKGSIGCMASPEKWTGGTLFHDICGGSNFKINNKSLSMNQVMIMNNNGYVGLADPDNLGCHIVAAILNSASKKTEGVLSVMAVIGMWNEWVSKGHFEPSAGAKWSSAQIVAYLQTTMTA